jgi:ribosome-binding factor A
VEALTRAKGFIRRRLAEMVRLRVTPAFSFRLDGSFDEAGHIEDLLRRPEVARDLVSGDEGSPAAESAAPPHDESHGHG